MLKAHPNAEAGSVDWHAVATAMETAVANSNITNANKVKLSFALFTAHHQAGNMKRAWTSLTRANAMEFKRHTMGGYFAQKEVTRSVK